MVNQQEKQMATRKRKQVNEAHHDKDHDMKKKKEMEKEEKKSAKKESTDKFQEMLEYLVNEDNEKAEEIFHEIVVEKSRQIYEELLAEELAEDSDEEVEESDDEEVEETADEEVEESEEEEVEENDEDLEEDFDLDEFDVEEAPMGGDAADDMEMDMDMDAEGDMDMDDMDMDGDEPATQDDIKDLEAELADLKAEFEELMADKDMDDDDMDMDMDDEDKDMDMDDDEMEKETDEYEDFEESSEEEVEEADDEEVEENNLPLTAAEQMREYVEKVSPSMGDNGAYTKSPVASKNDMGGDAGNIAQGGEEKGMTPAKPKEDAMGNVNVPGAKASKSMKAMPKGHGAEKKSAPEGAADKKSPIGS